MNKKDINELKRRFNKDKCTFTKMCGAFVNTDKNILLKLDETFLNLEEDDFHKYLDIAKKVLSGTIGNSLLQLDFPINKDGQNQKQFSLIKLKKSKLKDEGLLDEFYKSIIDNFDYDENYLILFFHDVYDIITKTTDNLKLDESEEVYEYVICAICPITLSAPGLSYFENENTIKSRMRDWIVGAPMNGFVYPAFIDRSADVNSVIYYTKNAKKTHPELMEDVLGCPSKDTSAIQKLKFQSVIKDSIAVDKEEADDLYVEVQDSLNNIVEEHKATAGEDDDEPLKLTKEELQSVLVENGVSEEDTVKIESYYAEEFTKEIPTVENLIDNTALKLSEQRKKEKSLAKQVHLLSTKLEEIESEAEEYDIIVKVKSEKIDQIKSQNIDGQEYILIPVNENEKSNINGLK